MIKRTDAHKWVTVAGAVVSLAVAGHVSAQSADSLINKLEQKGVLTTVEANELRAEAEQSKTNAVSHGALPKWKVSPSIKNTQLFGDLRMRYEYRGVDNAPGAAQNNYARERFRYAARVGLRGDLFDDFNYGIRLETSANPRSPWATFGNNTTSGSVTPSDKSQSGFGIGQVYLGWHPTSWYEMTVGRMPMPLYTTPMVWDTDINPEGAFEKFSYTVDNVDLFLGFGQFDYQDPNQATAGPTGDTFLLAWQMGAKVNLGENLFFKIAPTAYTYTGLGNTNAGLASSFVGQGKKGINVGVPAGVGGSYNPAYNQQGINDLLVLELPMEFNFKIRHTALGNLQARLFGDVAYNLEGDNRARAAYHASPAAFPGVGRAVTGQNKAFQFGLGIGSEGTAYGPTQGLVYGSAAKKNTWEARVYWQYIEQYALDVNLIDSDFFEGRANLQGVFAAYAYSFTEGIIGTVRYGYANRINHNLGTGGNNLDIPGLNPIANYNLVQLDLTWRF